MNRRVPWRLPHARLGRARRSRYDANTIRLYAAFNAVFLLFTWALVPETRGATLGQIERNLMDGKRLRDIGA